MQKGKSPTTKKKYDFLLSLLSNIIINTYTALYSSRIVVYAGQ